MSDSGSQNGKELRPGELSSEDRAAIKRRASELGAKLDAVKSRKEPPSPEASARGAAMGQAMRIAVELVVGVAIGGFVGWWLDKQLGTAPWLLVLFLILGFCAGMWNIIRTAQRLQAKAEPLQRNAPAIRDDEDDR